MIFESMSLPIFEKASADRGHDFGQMASLGTRGPWTKKKNLLRPKSTM